MSVLLSSTVSTGRGGRAQGRRLSNLTFGANHDAMHPSARDGRFHRRPSPRRIGCSQSMLRRRQIMDSAHTKTPLRPRRFLRQKITRRTVEEDLSGSFQLSCSSHPQSLYLRFSSCHCRGYGCGWLDPHLSQCHPLEPHLPGRSSAFLVSFHGLSPTVRSLHLSSTTTESFNLVCSFPLLEDLSFVFFGSKSEPDRWNVPLRSPKLTGSLDLRTPMGTRSVARRLLDLPDGLHFTKITVGCGARDSQSITELVSRCSDTLESLTISSWFQSMFSSASVIGQYLTAARSYRDFT